MNVPPLIHAVGLTKIFKDFWRRARVKAVNDLDLDVQHGEIFGLLGPNGSGKSTTIKMILGLLHPTRGRVSVFGRPPNDVRLKSRIGYLPEESYLYRFLNARETLNYYGSLFRLPRRDRHRRIEELLDMVGLRSAARRPVGEYSKGMARRIGLAQALINDPDLLILDEPTSGLDPIGAKLVKDIIIRIGKDLKKTVLLSSHLLADVEEVCDRVTILYGGKSHVKGTMQEVLSRQDMIQMTCERLAPETLAEIERLIERREGKTLSVTTPRDRLESLFLRIVEKARRKQVATSGAAEEGSIAGFLGEQEAGRGVLDELVSAGSKTEPPKEALAPVGGTEQPAAVDEGMLGALSGQKPQAAEQADSPAPMPSPAASKPEGAPAVEVDRSVLDELSGDGRGDDHP